MVLFLKKQKPVVANGLFIMSSMTYALCLFCYQCKDYHLEHVIENIREITAQKYAQKYNQTRIYKNYFPWDL